MAFVKDNRYERPKNIVETTRIGVSYASIFLSRVVIQPLCLEQKIAISLTVAEAYTKKNRLSVQRLSIKKDKRYLQGLIEIPHIQQYNFQRFQP